MRKAALPCAVVSSGSCSSRFTCCRRSTLRSEDARALAQSALADVGLAARNHHYAHQLSGGEQQRVALARAFVHRPKILFADEPTGNLDQRTGQSVGDLLFEMNRAHATTLLLVTHDQALAERCASVARLDGGTLAPIAAA